MVNVYSNSFSSYTLLTVLNLTGSSGLDIIYLLTGR
jgi:hypothetical protein